MKVTDALFRLAALLAGARGARTSESGVAGVVKILQGMLEKSQKEGKEEEELYQKFYCYCGTNQDEKKAAIAELTEQVAILENKVGEMQSSSGTLALECQQLQAAMVANEAARSDAEAIRTTSHEAFLADEVCYESCDLLGVFIGMLGFVVVEKNIVCLLDPKEILPTVHTDECPGRKLHKSGIHRKLRLLPSRMFEFRQYVTVDTKDA